MRTKFLLLIASGLLLASGAHGQNVGINATGAAPAASAILDLTSTTTGLLIPRVALTATNVAAPVVAPAVSLLVYNTATAGAAPNNVTPGFYYWNGAAWVQFATGTTGWTTIGNYGTSPAANWIGTNDANDWVIKTGGIAATNERARVLAGGQTVLNNTGLGVNTNDVFSVYANGTTNGTPNTSALGLRAINGYTSTGVGVFGNATGTTGTPFGLYGLASGATGTSNAVRGEAASNVTSAILGIGNTSGAAIVAPNNARGVAGQINGTLAGTGLGMGVSGITAATMTTGDARGVYGQTASDNGTGIFGNATITTITGVPVGAFGVAQSNTGFGVEGLNVAASGTGLVGEGNNQGFLVLPGGSGGAFTGTAVGSLSAATAGTGTGMLGVGNGLLTVGFLVGGGGGAFTGTNNGVYGTAVTPASGTGVIGTGNNSPVNALATGSGGAFTGTGTGTYSVATTVASGTGVIGVGNNALPANVLAGGSGGAFKGTTAGAFGLATTAASGTGVVGVGNNAGVNTLATGSGGAFTGTGTGAYALATTVAAGTGVVGVGNNAGANVLAGGSGGAFTGTGAGAYGRATNAASGTGLIGAGNNVAPVLLLAGSGAAGTGQLFGVYGVANSSADAVGTPARAGGYFESGTPVDAFTYVAAFESGLPRKVMGNGTMNTVVKNTRDEYVLLSAPEAPENLFQDYGTGQLANGRAHVQLDPTLTKNILVNEEHPIRVFVQLRGDCKGVFVTNENASGFDVIELQGGTSDASFYWTVTANRADVTLADGTVLPFAQERFGRTMGPQLTQQAVNQTSTTGTASSLEIENTTIPSVQPELNRSKGRRMISAIGPEAEEATPATDPEGGR